MSVQFENAAYFWLLLPLAWLLWQRGTPPLRLAQISQLPSVPTWRLRLRPVRPLLQTVVLLALILALARPRLAPQIPQTAVSDAALLVVLDISNSMRAQDLTPDRLTTAKQQIQQLIDERPSWSIGVVLVAERPLIHTPPTVDHANLRERLERVQFAEEMGVQDGSALGSGLAVALNLLASHPAADRHILLLTDGNNTDQALDPLTVAESAATLDIPIHTIGLGRDGLVPFPQRGLNGPYRVEWESEINPALLAQISDRTGGWHEQIEEDEWRGTYSFLTSTAVLPSPPRPLMPPVELFPWLIAIAIGLAVLERSLGETVLRQLPEEA